MAPQKGKMADSPLPCEHVTEGPTANVTLSMAQLDQMSGDIMRAVTGTSV
jgi:hypothetical protein